MTRRAMLAITAATLGWIALAVEHAHAAPLIDVTASPERSTCNDSPLATTLTVTNNLEFDVYAEVSASCSDSPFSVTTSAIAPGGSAQVSVSLSGFLFTPLCTISVTARNADSIDVATNSVTLASNQCGTPSGYLSASSLWFAPAQIGVDTAVAKVWVWNGTASTTNIVATMPAFSDFHFVNGVQDEFGNETVTLANVASNDSAFVEVTYTPTQSFETSAYPWFTGSAGEVQYAYLMGNAYGVSPTPGDFGVVDLGSTDDYNHLYGTLVTSGRQLLTLDASAGFSFRLSDPQFGTLCERGVSPCPPAGAAPVTTDAYLDLYCDRDEAAPTDGTLMVSFGGDTYGGGASFGPSSVTVPLTCERARAAYETRSEATSAVCADETFEATFSVESTGRVDLAMNANPSLSMGVDAGFELEDLGLANEGRLVALGESVSLDLTLAGMPPAGDYAYAVQWPFGNALTAEFEGTVAVLPGGVHATTTGIDFGDVAVGQARAAQASIKVCVAEGVTITSVDAPAGFDAGARAPMVAHHGTAEIGVLFHPTEEGEVDGDLTVATSAGTVVIPLRGVGVAGSDETDTESYYGCGDVGAGGAGALPLVVIGLALARRRRR